jgi:PAS domain S-box-containing protein
MTTNLSQRDQEHAAPAPASEGQVEKLTEAIIRSQHSYRELIDNLDQALFTLSLQGEVRVANLRLSEILGASFQELIGRPLGDFVESPTFEEAQRALPGLLKAGVWSGTIPVWLKKDKALRYFDCWLQTAVEGEVTSIIGWARDVTKQQESEIRFKELFESFSEGILFVTPAGQLLDANPALVNMLGYGSKEELQAINFRDVYADPSSRDAIMRDLEAKGSIHEREIVMRRKDGRQINCLTSGFAICDASGRPVRLQGTLVDITERKQMEKRIQQEQGFTRRLVASFPDLIAVLDREGRFIYISDHVEKSLGWRPDDYVGRVFGTRANEEDKKKLHDMFQRIVRGEVSRAQVEFRSPHADGGWRVLLLTASPFFDEDGQISGLVTSARDVTEAKQAEQQLAEKEKFAAMGQMMAGAAHELNNPLTAILGVSDLLRERAVDDAMRRQVDLILQQARRAAGIVQNLLAFSRPLAQGRTRLRLDEIVKEALAIERSNFEKKNISAKFTAPADLPPVDGDRKLLLQVFLNILVNAEQSISPAHEQGVVDVSMTLVGDKIRVIIADDGPGIPPEIIGKIFDPFFTTKRPGGGSGLGLTICLAVIKEHGGTIEIESKPSGATVHVSLPAVAGVGPSQALADSAVKLVPSPVGSQMLRGYTALVVDDEESIREIVQEGLAARGMSVQAAESSEAALAYLARNTCEIILCDFNLPGMSGEKLFEELRARLGDSLPRFVFMTGELVDPSVVERYREKGARVLQKPFQMSALATLLAELLQPQPSPTK